MGLTGRVALALALHFAGPSGAVAQEAAEVAGWAVRTTRVSADVSETDLSADVRIVFSLEWVGPADAETATVDLRLELLGFAAATADSLFIDGRSHRLETTVGDHKSVGIPLRPGQRELTVLYRVDRAVEADGTALRGRIPLVTGPPPPAESGGDGFVADLRLPEEWRIADAFPSGLRADPDGGYGVSLPAVPAMIGFRARSDGTWRPGFPFLIDLLTLGVLIVFAGAGWRHLSGVVDRGVADSGAVDRGEIA